MGLFGSKKKTYRDFSLTRVIDDDYLPDVIGQAITTYVLDDKNTKDLADLMIEYGMKSNAVKWDMARKWAAKPGNYSYGVPHVTAVTQTDFTDADSLDTILKSLTGAPALTYVYSLFSDVNLRHGMWQLLVSNYGYNPTNNRLDSLSQQLGVDVFLYDTKSYLTPDTQLLAADALLVQRGFASNSGATQNRVQDLSRAITPDGTSTTGANYTHVQYTFRFTGVTTTTTNTNTKVTTTIKTPDGAGGYTETSSVTNTPSTSTDTDMGGKTLPANVISQIKVGSTTTTNDVTDPPVTNSTTDSNGVITEVKTEVTHHNVMEAYSLDCIAWFDMGYGVYDFDPRLQHIDTTTVLDERDSDDIDPHAVLKPSGEDTQTSDDYFQACFYYTDAAGITHINYFTYQYGSGSYPSLDGIASTAVKGIGEHFPRIYARWDGDRLDAARFQNTANYKTSKKLSNKLDLDWLDFMNDVYKAMPSLKKIRDIIMLQCVPANTSDKIEQEYLFKYFKTLYNLRKPLTFPTPTPGSTRPPSTYETYAAHQGATVQSNDNQSQMNNAFDALGWRKVTGSIGPKYTTQSGRGTGTKVVRQVTYESETTGGGGANNNGTTKTVEKVTYVNQSVNYHYYRMQTSDTEYEEVLVFALSFTYRVGGHNKGKSGDDENLMVPLDRAFRNEFTPHERETLYARATHLLIATEYTVKKKWYQTGVFKVVITAVAVVLSWWTAGASLSLVAALTAVATAVAAQIGFALLSKYVFSKLGGAFAIVATVVAIAIAVYTGYVAISGAQGAFNLTAQQLMMASNVAFKAGESAMQGEMLKIQEDMADLQGEMQHAQSQLEAANHELNARTMSIDDTALLGAIKGYTMLGEDAQSYYARTLNNNAGIAALNLPDLYYGMQKSLPTPVSIFAQIQQNIDKPFELNNDLYL